MLQNNDSHYNAVLIYPKVGDETYAVPHMPLSVLSVASATQQKGYKVKVVDQRVDLDWKKIIANSVSKSLLCFGISSMTGPQLIFALEIAKYIREVAPDIPIVWGGVHASLLPEQTINSGYADIVVMREGEVTFPELLNTLKINGNLDSVSGIVYKSDSGEIRTTIAREFCNLDEYAFLDYGLIKLIAYQRQGQERVPRANSVSLYTSRGCQFKCTYCYNNSFHDSTWRGQSAEVVIENLAAQYKNGIKKFIICDEYFFQDLNRARSICRSLIERKLSLRFYYVNCRLDQIKKMSDEDLALFFNAGIRDLFIGIESGSLEELKRIKKGIDLSYLNEACRRLLRQGYSVQFSFMLGLPDETVSDIKETTKLMVKILDNFPVFYVPSPGKFIPFPGTEAYERTIAKGWQSPKNIEEWGNIVSTVNCSDWLGQKVGKIAKQTAFFASAMDTKISSRSNPILELMRKLYSQIAKFRSRYGFVRFVPEFLIFQSPLKAFFQKKAR